MAKCIKIEDCKDCPNSDHAGGFARVAYVPLCRLNGEQLPHTTQAATGRTARMYASPLPGIPDWCPLPLFPESKAE